MVQAIFSAAFVLPRRLAISVLSASLLLGLPVSLIADAQNVDFSELAVSVEACDFLEIVVALHLKQIFRTFGAGWRGVLTGLVRWGHEPSC